MIGFGIGETDFENSEARVDGPNETDIACQFVEKRDAAIAQAVNAFGNLITEITTGQDGSGHLGKLGLVEPALDFALAGGQLSAYFVLHSKSLSWTALMDREQPLDAEKGWRFRAFLEIVGKSTENYASLWARTRW